jgi:uncharacterized protein YukE
MIDAFDMLRHVQTESNKAQKQLEALRSEREGLAPPQQGMTDNDYSIAITSWQGKLTQLIDLREWILSKHYS